MSDLIERLRAECRVQPMEVLRCTELFTEAADALESQAKRIAELEAALLPAYSALVECETILGGEYGDQYGTLVETMIDLHERIAALKETPRE